MAQRPSRYAMDEEPMPDAPMDAMPGDDDMMSDEEMEQYNRHCYGHPLAPKFHAHMSKKYAMPAEEEPPPHDPTMAPDADEPHQFSAGFPSATNVTPPMRNGKGMNGKHQADDGVDRIRANQYQRRLEAMERELALGKADNCLKQLVYEGYDLDENAEREAFAVLDDEGRKKRMAHVRRYYKQMPVGGGRIIGQEIRSAGDAEAEDQGPSPAHYQRAMQYMREHPGMRFDAACEATKDK